MKNINDLSLIEFMDKYSENIKTNNLSDEMIQFILDELEYEYYRDLYSFKFDTLGNLYRYMIIYIKFPNWQNKEIINQLYDKYRLFKNLCDKYGEHIFNISEKELEYIFHKEKHKIIDSYIFILPDLDSGSIIDMEFSDDFKLKELLSENFMDKFIKKYMFIDLQELILGNFKLISSSDN